MYIGGGDLVCKCLGQCIMGESVQCGGVYTGSAQFLLIIKIDQLETTKSHMINMSARLTNHK